MKHKDAHLILFIAASFIFLCIDVYLGHATSKMHNSFMWLPLLFFPVAVIVTIFSANSATVISQKLFFAICLIAVLLGILGFYFHLTKLQAEVQGTIQWEIFARFMRYPPLLAPLAISGIGILGLLVINRNT